MMNHALFLFSDGFPFSLGYLHIPQDKIAVAHEWSHKKRQTGELAFSRISISKHNDYLKNDPEFKKKRHFLFLFNPFIAFHEAAGSC